MTLTPDLLEPPLAAAQGLTLRLVGQDDYDDLLAACYPHKSANAFWHHFEQLMEWQEDGRTVWLVAERNGRIIGSGELILYPHSTEIANVFVIPPHRRRGVGTALLIVLLRIARHLGETAVELGVTQDNAGAKALYQRLGFVEERQVKLPGGETAVILRKTL